MANNDVNNQKKLNNAFNVCRYIAVILGMILLSNWTVKSAPLVNSTKQVLQQDIFKEITGIVKNQDGEPILGVVVKLVGTNVETVTDAEGRYKFNVKKGDKIQFIYRGYKTSLEIVRKSNVLNIKMKQDDSDLPDVTISLICRSATGHTGVSEVSVRKYEGVPITKSVSTSIVDKGRPNATLLQTLTSPFMPLFFNVDMRPSEAYRNSESILKDVENLTRNGNYTYIVDGVRVSEETFRSLNQNDVESVDIYKHTDIYNARFGNKENQSRIALDSK